MKLNRVKVWYYKVPVSPKLKILIIAIILLIVLGISSQFLHSQEYIISDYDFTNQEYNYNEVRDFIRTFPNNKFTDKEIKYLSRECDYSYIFPVAALAWFEKESGIIRNPPPEPRYTKLKNLIGGYGLHYRKRLHGKKMYKYYSYEVQVKLTLAKFRQFFDAWVPGKSVYVKNLKRRVEPINAASFAVLTMNPMWGKNKEYKRASAGAELFTTLYNSLHLKWVTKETK